MPFTALPPLPRPGGRVRASLGPVPHGGLPFVLVHVNGESLGLAHGARIAPGERVLLEQPLPDDMALLGLALELRGGLFEAATGRLSWSRTLVLR